jgi:arylsulfatase A-like enzyme
LRDSYDETSAARFGAVLAGSVAAAVAFAGAEVLWITGKPFLRTTLMEGQQLLPPYRFAWFVLFAVATYVGLALLAAPVVAWLLGRVRSSTTAVGAFFVGCFVTGSLLATGATIVWLAMLASDASLFSPGSLARYGIAALGVTGAIALACWIGSRVFHSPARSALAVGVALPALLVALAWIAHRQLEYPIRRTAAPKPGLPNVLFVTIDTLRADFTGAATGGAVATPNLDRLGAEGVRFTTAISQVPTTTPSHVSMFTSNYPFAHGAKNGVPMRADLPTLSAELAALGYHTAAFISAYTTRSTVTGLGGSFDVYQDSLNPALPFLANDEIEPLFPYRLLDRMAGNEIPAPVVNERVESWLDGGPREPFFAWVHYFDPHLPYRAPPEYEQRYLRAEMSPQEREIALYKAEISYTDDQLGALLASFERRGLLDDAIVVVTSDHGEAFNEPHPHVDAGHGMYLYDSVLRVPLLFWSPQRIPAGRVVDEQVESIDIAPTLLELVAAERPAHFVGRSLVATWRGGAPGKESVALSQTANVVRPRWFSVRTKQWKLLVNPDDGKEELFDLGSDPEERSNLVEREPGTAARYRDLLVRTMRFDQEGAGLEVVDADTVRRLQALGYLPEEEKN